MIKCYLLYNREHRPELHETTEEAGRSRMRKIAACGIVPASSRRQDILATTALYIITKPLRRVAAQEHALLLAMDFARQGRLQ
jgi:hypothetical protein